MCVKRNKPMTYTIKKGSHDSTNPLMYGFHSGIDKLKGTIKFHSNCKYDLTNEPICVNDTNKAIGFGYGVLPYSHQKWSIRLGWRCNSSGKLILVNYSYVNGQRVEQRIGLANTFQWDTEYEFEIINDQINKLATVRVGTEVISIPFFYNERDKDGNYIPTAKKPVSGYYLHPYFGGDCSAPHDMNIIINLL